MSVLTVAPKLERASLAASMSLDELLIDMRRYGLPSVSMPSKDGWHASVAMHTNALGAEFKIRSEFSMSSAIAAVRQCHDRMRDALATLAKTEREAG